MTCKVGKNFKVTLGSDQILGIGTVSLDGQTNQMLDNSEFQSVVRTFCVGLRDGGTVSISGLYKPSDSTGQEVVQQSFINGTAISNLRVYVDSTSYFEPCQTTGYFSPNSTTGNNTVLSEVYVQDHTPGSDKEALSTWSATFKVSGDMVLV